MILRLILIILAIWAGYALIKTIRRLGQKRTSTKTKPALMVKCDYCGTHIPADSTIRSDTGNYCSADHLEKDKHP